MEIFEQVVLWGRVSSEELEKYNTGIALALRDAIELLPAIDRRHVYAAKILQPKEGDYPYRVGYEQNGKKEWWAGDSFFLAVQYLRNTMSPEGRAERQRLNIPMPGETN